MLSIHIIQKCLKSSPDKAHGGVQQVQDLQAGDLQLPTDMQCYQRAAGKQGQGIRFEFTQHERDTSTTARGAGEDSENFRASIQTSVQQEGHQKPAHSSQDVEKGPGNLFNHTDSSISM